MVDNDVGTGEFSLVLKDFAHACATARVSGHGLIIKGGVLSRRKSNYNFHMGVSLNGSNKNINMKKYKFKQTKKDSRTKNVQ